MKKIYLLALLFSMTGYLSAQTYLSEDFSGGVMPPDGWSIDQIATKWSISASNKAGGTAPEGKFTYTSGTYTTRLISPVIDLTGLTTVTLMFNHMYDWYSNPAPKLGVATRTGSGSWTTVWETTPTGNINAQTKVLEISNSDVGAGFQFCFYLSGNMYNIDYWFVDDIFVMTPPVLDAALAGITLPYYMAVGDPTTLTGKVKNLGSTVVNSFDIAYTVETGTPVLYSVTGQNLALGESYNFTHPEDLVFADPGTYNVHVKVQNVNGTGDNDPTNDTLSQYVGVVPYAPAKKVFCEEATGTWCGWCVRGICFMDYMGQTYPDTWIGAAVHNGDPMVVADWDDAIPNIIPDFPGYPSGTINRVKMWDPEEFEQGYQEEIASVTPATVEVVNFSWDPGTREVAFDVKSQFLLDIYNEMRFAAVILEDSLYGTTSTWGQANYYSGGGYGDMCGFEVKPDPIPAADMHYDHVGRVILDGPYGTPGSVTAPITAGSTHSWHYTYTIPADWVYEKLHFVGLILDYTTGIIMNATDEVTWVGTSERNNDMNLKVYPNPASDKTSLRFTLQKPGNVLIRVYDLPGNCVATLGEAEYPAGEQRVAIDVSTLKQGLYFVEVTVNGHSNTHKIAVTR